MVKPLPVAEATPVSAVEVNVEILPSKNGAENFSIVQGQQMQRSGSDGIETPNNNTSTPTLRSRCCDLFDSLCCSWDCGDIDCGDADCDCG